jgi:radical SAM superfamily enzyme YgiQ (UPF0313 family)
MADIALVYRSVAPEGDHSTGNEVEVMPPLWALALLSYLRAAMPGAKAEIIDEQLLGREAFMKKLAACRCRLAGLSPTAHTYQGALECARVLKRNGALVVLGGHYATPMAREIIKRRGPGSADHCVDAVVRFDGEKAFHALAAGRPFSSIKNLVYAGPGGAVLENEVETLDLAALPPVDYEVADLEAYFKLQRPPAHACLTLPFVAQRGCRLSQGAGRCIFCSIQTSGPCRSVPPAEAARRMAGLAAKYGVGYVYEGSDDLVADSAWFREFAAVAAGLKMPVLQVHALPSRLNAGILKALGSINAGYLALGVESLSDIVLSRLGKGATARSNRSAIERICAAGLVPNVNLILGLPGESRRSLSETFAALRELDLPADAWRRFSCPRVALFPGTEIFRMLLKKEPKYHGLDYISADESFADWVRHFCELEAADVMAARDIFHKLAESRISGRRGGRKG